MIDRTPAQAAKILETTIHQVIKSSQQAREAGNDNWQVPSKVIFQRANPFEGGNLWNPLLLQLGLNVKRF